MVIEYRYALYRRLTDPDERPRRMVCWCLLNPSTADDVKDDQTVRRMIHISREHGYDDLMVVNLFAARSTDPDELIAMGDDARGTENADYIKRGFDRAHAIVFAWGAWWTTNVSRRRNLYPGLPRLNVEGMVSRDAIVLCCGKTKNGDPKHPCRLPNDTKLVPW